MKRTRINLDEAKARIAELEEALRQLGPLVGTMLDEEWFLAMDTRQGWLGTT